MSTAKVLQKAVILELIGSTLRIQHPDLRNRPKTTLSSSIAAAGTAMTVLDNNGFADDDWFIIGNPGDNQTEEDDVNGTVTRGTSITVTNTLKFSHEINAPVTKINERAIKIYGASTDGGSGTLIASIDAITTPIADAFNIQWNRPYTEYTLISTDTAFAYYFVKFTDGTTDGAASDYIPSTGWPYNAAATIIRQALDSTNTDIDGQKFNWQMMVDWTQDFQNEVSQYTYQDPRTGKLVKKDWNHEITEDETSLTLVQNQDRYSLSSLTYTPKYLDSGRAIINLQVGDREPLIFYEFDEFIRLMRDTHRTLLDAQATAGATSITVESTAAFDDSGTLLIDADVLTYTAKTATTFTGIPSSGDGSITATHDVDDPVWQNITQAIPEVYTVLRSSIRLNRPCNTDAAGETLKIRYYRQIPRITEASDTTVIPFTNVGVKYLKMRIEERKGNLDKAEKFKKDFEQGLLQNAQADSQPLTQSYTYYNYTDPDEEMSWTSWDD